ncbi:MAG: hypothetical protein R3A80_08205 [Bdellovibrionota bacterium]
MKKGILYKLTANVLLSSIVLQSMCLPLHAKSNLRASFPSTAQLEKIQQLRDTVSDIKEMHEKHKRLSQEQLQYTYDWKLYDATTELAQKINLTGEDDKKLPRLKKLLGKIQDERRSIYRKSRADILKNEEKEIRYLEDKLASSNKEAEMRNPIYMFMAMFGVLFCVTIVLMPIGISMMDWAFENTNDLYWTS